MIDWATVGVALLAAIGGSGGIVTLLAKRGDWRHQREESEIGRLREEISDFRQREEACADRLEAAEARIMLLEHHHASLLCRWIKDAAQRLTWINDRALLAIFAPLGLGREDVLGKTFREVLDEWAASEIERLDERALAASPMPASTVLRLHPLLPVMVVVKVAGMGRDGSLIYEGIAYRLNDPAMADAAGAARQVRAIEAAAEHVIDGAVD